MNNNTKIFLLFSSLILLRKKPAGKPKIRHNRVEINDNFKDTKLTNSAAAVWHVVQGGSLSTGSWFQV